MEGFDWMKIKKLQLKMNINNTRFVAIALISLIGLSVFSVIMISKARGTTSEDLENKLMLSSFFLLRTGEAYIWDMDYNPLNNIIKSVVENDDDIVAIEFFNINGELVTTKQEYRDANTKTITKDIIYQQNKKKIGVMKIVYSTMKLTERGRSFTMFVVVFAIIFIFAIFLSLIFINKTLMKFSGDMIKAAKEIINEATKISDGNEGLNKRTKDQASSLERTAATIEQFTSTIKQTADNSKNATGLAGDVTGNISQGNQLSVELCQAMDLISESGKKISEITGVVNELAFQTNILAINAAIEAAKAGDMGNGFAVVAIEVRDLAQRSADAAGEISELISDSLARVKKGEDIVKLNVEFYEKINVATEKLTQLIKSISTVSQEQYSAIEDISNTIQEIDVTTKSNLSFVDDIFLSSKDMVENSRQMEVKISQNLKTGS